MLKEVNRRAGSGMEDIIPQIHTRAPVGKTKEKSHGQSLSSLDRSCTHFSCRAGHGAWGTGSKSSAHGHELRLSLNVDEASAQSYSSISEAEASVPLDRLQAVLDQG